MGKAARQGRISKSEGPRSGNVRGVSKKIFDKSNRLSGGAGSRPIGTSLAENRRTENIRRANLPGSRRSHRRTQGTVASQYRAALEKMKSLWPRTGHRTPIAEELLSRSKPLARPVRQHVLSAAAGELRTLQERRCAESPSPRPRCGSHRRMRGRGISTRKSPGMISSQLRKIAGGYCRFQRHRLSSAE